MASPSSPQDPYQNPNPNPNHHHHLNEHQSSPSQSPPSNPSSSQQNPLLQSTPSSNKKPQPSLWSHQETVNLIEAYQEKWYANKRGPLKASQWEEIAVTVAARCGYDDPSKTAVQCRHKIEKLRKRYRADKHRPNPRAGWEYFDLMDRLEHGPFPVSARPMAMVQYHNSVPRRQDVYAEEEEEEEEEQEEVNVARYSDRRNRSNEPHKRKLSAVGGRVSGFLEKPMIQKHKKRIERYESEEEEAEEEEDEEEEAEEEEVAVAVGGGVGELAVEIKAFAERFVKMEKKKMEMMRETERYRMEMENKRMEMILESQRMIVDTIGRAFGSHNKKFKMAQDS